MQQLQFALINTLINTTRIHKIQRQKIENVNEKIPDCSGFVATTVLDTKIKENDNEIPDLSGIVKKTDYDAKI